MVCKKDVDSSGSDAISSTVKGKEKDKKFQWHHGCKCIADRKVKLVSGWVAIHLLRMFYTQ